MDPHQMQNVAPVCVSILSEVNCLCVVEDRGFGTLGGHAEAAWRVKDPSEDFYDTDGRVGFDEDEMSARRRGLVYRAKKMSEVVWGLRPMGEVLPPWSSP